MSSIISKRLQDVQYLQEIRSCIEEGVDKKDPTKIQMAYKLIDDWIDELLED